MLLLPLVEVLGYAAAATFPVGLPGPRSGGYTVKPVDQTVRTDMESGAPRQRRRTTARNERIPLSWQMSDADFATFKAWFFDAQFGIAGGANWFTISLPIGAGGMSSVSARFIGPFQATYQDGFWWSVSGEVEIR